MGLCCSNRRNYETQDVKEEEIETNNPSSSVLHSLDNFTTEDIHDNKAMRHLYSNACKQEDIYSFVKYMKHNNKITFDKEINLGWIQQPQTLSDLAAYQLYYIISKKVKCLLLLGSTKNCSIDSFVEFEVQIEKSKLINIMKDHFLALISDISNESLYCKADCFILSIVNLIELYDINSKYFQNNEFMKLMLHYITILDEDIYDFNTKNHIIATLQILRKLYYTKIPLRVLFINSGGLDAFKKHILAGQEDIIQEMFYNIQDLVYVST